MDRNHAVLYFSGSIVQRLGHLILTQEMSVRFTLEHLFGTIVQRLRHWTLNPRMEVRFFLVPVIAPMPEWLTGETQVLLISKSHGFESHSVHVFHCRVSSMKTSLPCRLTARISGFHPEGRGSIPRMGKR